MREPSIERTLEAYEKLLRDFDGDPPEDQVTMLVRSHENEQEVLDRMIEVAERLGYM